MQLKPPPRASECLRARRPNRFWQTATLALLCSLAGGAATTTAAPANDTYDLRVFGKLTTQEREVAGTRCIRIATADAAKARVVYSKLVSDFTTLPTVKAEAVIVSGSPLTVLAFAGGRRLLP